jgi:hypothetical protein
LRRKKKKRRRAPHPDIPPAPLKKALVLDKKLKGCIKCGEKRPWIIDLHHVNPKTKKFGISRGVRDPVTLRDFVKELKKCVPLCRNHHGDFHHREVYDKITLEEYINDGKP